MPKENRNIEMLLADIEKILPPIVFRNWPKWRDVLPVSPRTVANDDSLGVGPKEKIYIGRNAGYPRSSLMEYLRAKSRVALENRPRVL
jgi:hypothetical protein